MLISPSFFLFYFFLKLKSHLTGGSQRPITSPKRVTVPILIPNNHQGRKKARCWKRESCPRCKQLPGSGMIIKTKLSTDSPLYRLTEVQIDTQFISLLNEIANQWSLSTDEEHHFIWKEELIIGSDKEWQLFQRIHLAGKEDEIVELRVVSLSTLAQLL